MGGRNGRVLTVGVCRIGHAFVAYFVRLGVVSFLEFSWSEQLRVYGREVSALIT